MGAESKWFLGCWTCSSQADRTSVEQMRPGRFDGGQAGEELECFLGPLLLYTSTARTCRKLCIFFLDRTRSVLFSNYVCGLDRPQFLQLLGKLVDKFWGLQDVLQSLSGRGWLQRIQHVDHLEVIFDGLLAELRPVLAEGRVTMDKADNDAWADGKAELRGLSAAMAHRCAPSALRQLAGDTGGREAFITALLPFLHCRADETAEELRDEVRWELEYAFSQLVVGPHLAIRHADMRMFWYIHYHSAGQVLWSTFWHDFSAFLDSPSGAACEELGSIPALREMMHSEQRLLLEAAICNRYNGSVTGQCLDSAINPSMSVEANFSHIGRLYGLQQRSSSPSRSSNRPSLSGRVYVRAMPTLVEQDELARLAGQSGAGDGSSAELLNANNLVAGFESSSTSHKLIGRDADITQLADYAKADGTRVVVLSGSKGVGKSALAAVLCLRLIGEDRWATARSADWRCVTSLDGAALAVCTALSVPAPAVAGFAGFRQLDAYLRRVGRTLHGGLILENVDALLRPPITGTPGSKGVSATQHLPAAVALRLLCDLAAATPNMQLVLTASSWDSTHTEALTAAIQGSRSAGITAHPSSLPGRPAAPVAVHLVQPLEAKSAMQLLLLHANQQLPPQQAATICTACGGLPAVIRTAGCALRQGVLGATGLEVAAMECQGLTEAPPGSPFHAARHGMHRTTEPLKPFHFLAEIVRHVFKDLTSEHQMALQVLCQFKVPLAQDAINTLLQPLGHPCAVSALLCKLYDLGLCHFHDQAQLHEVDSGVQQYIMDHMTSLDERAVGDASSGPASPPGRLAVPKNMVTGAMLSPSLSLAVARVGALMQACQHILDETLALYQTAGGRQAAMRLYMNQRVLVDQGLLVLGDWLLAHAPASKEAEQYLQLMAWHLNNICRLVMGPTQLLLYGSLVQQLSPFQQDGLVRATALITAARVLAFNEHALKDGHAMLCEAQALMRPFGTDGSIPSPAASGSLQQPSGRLATLFSGPSARAQPQAPHMASAGAHSMRWSVLLRHEPVEHVVDELIPEELMLLAKAELAQAQGADLAAVANHLEALLASMHGRRASRTTLCYAQMMMLLGDVSSKLAAAKAVSSSPDWASWPLSDPEQRVSDAGLTTGVTWWKTATQAHAQAYTSLGQLYHRGRHWLSARAKLRWAAAHARWRPTVLQRSSSSGGHGSRLSPVLRLGRESSLEQQVQDGSQAGPPPDVEACIQECLQVHAATQGWFSEDVAECHNTLGTYLTAQAAQLSEDSRQQGTTSHTQPTNSELSPSCHQRAVSTGGIAQAEPRVLLQRAMDNHKAGCNMLLDLVGDLSPLTLTALNSFAATLQATAEHKDAARVLKHHATQLSIKMAAVKGRRSMSARLEEELLQGGAAPAKDTAALLEDLLKPGGAHSLATPLIKAPSSGTITPITSPTSAPALQELDKAFATYASPGSPGAVITRVARGSEVGSCTSPKSPEPHAPEQASAVPAPASPVIPVPPHMRAAAAAPAALTASVLLPPALTPAAATVGATPDANTVINGAALASSMLLNSRPPSGQVPHASVSNTSTPARNTTALTTASREMTPLRSIGRWSANGLPPSGLTVRTSGSGLPGSSSTIISDHVARAPSPVLAPALEAMKSASPVQPSPQLRERESQMFNMPVPDAGMMAANPLFNASPSLRVMDDVCAARASGTLGLLSEHESESESESM